MNDSSYEILRPTVEIYYHDYVISPPAAGLSIIACIIALVLLIYFKLYRSFIYRLVLYSFLILIVFTLSNSTGLITEDYVAREISHFLFFVSLITTFLLATIITLCICILALCNHQFTYRADIVLLISLILGILAIIGIVLAALYPIVLPLFVPILVNASMTVLTLMQLCCGACGYNLCLKNGKSTRKALMEILPLLVVQMISYFVTVLIISQNTLLDGETGYLIKMFFLISGTFLILIAALPYVLHLCYIKNKQGRQHSNDKTAMSTEEKGMSETSYTEYPSKDEDDTQQ